MSAGPGTSLALALGPGVWSLSLRYALRTLRKSPLLTATLILSLGIGTGANAAVFNLISALFLRAPEGIADPGSLVTIHPTDELRAANQAGLTQLRASGHFSAIAAYDDSLVTSVSIGGTAQDARVAFVTGDFFTTLGMQASQGRLPTASDTGTAVISHRLWEAYRRPDIGNATLLVIDGEALPIVGVMPTRFRGLHMGRTTDVWRLLPETAANSENSERTLSIVARLREGGTLPPEYAARAYTFMDPGLEGKTTLLAVILGGASVLVLVCACVTAASLLLSRGNARRRDIAIKLALGAERRAIVKQLMLESAITGLAAGSVGLLFAYWTTRIIPSLFAPEQATMLDARLTFPIVAVTLAGAALLGMTLSLMPAKLGTAPVTLLELRGDAGSISEGGPGVRAQTLLVVAQMALATLLVTGAMLLNRSLDRALSGEFADRTRSIAVVRLTERPRSFSPFHGLQDHARLQAQAIEKAGAQSAAIAAALPLERPGRRTYRVEVAPGRFQRIDIDTNIVSGSYFLTLGQPITGGRGFKSHDSWRAPMVAVIDDVMQQRYFGDSSAIGRKLIDALRNWEIEIVGVVMSGRYRTMQEAPLPTVYLPATQHYSARVHLLVRGAAPAEAMARSVDANVPRGFLNWARIAALDTLIEEALVLERFATLLVTASGVMALLLSILGAYSLMVDSVQRRTREIGLRVALGAGALRIMRSVFGYGLGLAATGVAIGLALTLAADRALRTFVFGLPPLDLMMLGMAAGALLVVVTLAAILPMRHALRVSPTIALRHT